MFWPLFDVFGFWGDVLDRFVRNSDVQSGFAFIAFGVGALFLALGYPRGTPGQMGPGFFPFWLGVLLAIVGVAVLVKGLRSGASDPMARIEWRALAAITVAVVVSGLLLRPAGLAIAIPALVVISALASRDLRPVTVAVTAAVLTFMAWLIFIAGLGLRIPVIGPAIW